MSASVPSRRRELPVQRLSVPDPWGAFVIPVSAFPVPENERTELRSALAGWCSQIAAKHKLTPSAWIQMAQLPLEKSTSKLSANGRAWLPMTGLGVWPDREPPRLWRRADFHDRDFGQPLPAMMNTVFHISAGDKACVHALETMLGSATVLYALLEQGPDLYHEAMRALLLPPITEEALKSHPFYVPLMEARSLRNISDATLASWMGPAKVYIRESVEDKGILVICAFPATQNPLYLP